MSKEHFHNTAMIKSALYGQREIFESLWQAACTCMQLHATDVSWLKNIMASHQSDVATGSREGMVQPLVYCYSYCYSYWPFVATGKIATTSYSQYSYVSYTTNYQHGKHSYVPQLLVLLACYQHIYSQCDVSNNGKQRDQSHELIRNYTCMRTGLTTTMCYVLCTTYAYNIQQLLVIAISIATY